MEADPVHVELLGAVNIGYRYRDELDLPVHAQQPTRRIGQFSRPLPRPQVGAIARPPASGKRSSAASRMTTIPGAEATFTPGVTSAASPRSPGLTLARWSRSTTPPVRCRRR